MISVIFYLLYSYYDTFSVALVAEHKQRHHEKHSKYQKDSTIAQNKAAAPYSGHNMASVASSNLRTLPLPCRHTADR